MHRGEDVQEERKPAGGKSLCGYTSASFESEHTEAAQRTIAHSWSAGGSQPREADGKGGPVAIESRRP